MTGSRLAQGFLALALSAVTLAITAGSAVAQNSDQTAPNLPPPISAPPGLDLQRMMEALRQQTQPAGQNRELLTPQVIPPRLHAPTVPSPNVPAPAIQTPGAPAPLRTPNLPIQRAIQPQTDRAPAMEPVELPDTLAPFTEPVEEEPVAEDPGAGGTADDAATVSPAPGPDTLPSFGDMPDPRELLRLGGDGGAAAAALGTDLQALARSFAGDMGMAVTADTMRAQYLAVSFIDYLQRRDRARIRGVIGLPFYADDFPIETEEDLNRLLGEPVPISGPPLPVVPERREDRLIGITTMRVTEFRQSPFYLRDRGADLVGLQDNDFYVRAVFERGDLVVPMIVYVRRVRGNSFEIAGFFD